MDYEILFLKSLALTIFIETIVLMMFFRLIVRNKEANLSRLMSTGFLASFATLPYLWFILPNFTDQRIWYIIIGEFFAILAETVIIGTMLRLNFLKSLLCSFTCNMASFLTGLLLQWP